MHVKPFYRLRPPLEKRAVEKFSLREIETQVLDCDTTFSVKSPTLIPILQVLFEEIAILRYPAAPLAKYVCDANLSSGGASVSCLLFFFVVSFSAV